MIKFKICALFSIQILVIFVTKLNASFLKFHKITVTAKVNKLVKNHDNIF